jgi:hypothetical protein
MFSRFFLALPDYPNIIISILKRAQKIDPIRVLDLGAGNAKYWWKVENELPSEVANRIHLTLLDAVGLPQISIGEFQVNRIEGVLPEVLKSLAENSYDLVVAIDLIEHLDKSQGYHLLYEIDRISDLASLIFTPNGFVWQPPSANNKFNAHVSGWTPRELRNLGWKKIYGQGGLKGLVGPYASPKFNGKTITKVIHISSLILAVVPRLSFAFTAVKFKKNPRIANQRLN